MIRQVLRQRNNLVQLVSIRAYSQPKGTSPGAIPAAAAAPPSGNVPGLSSRCVHKKDGPIGPGASHDGDYKVPEYFCYDKASYFEAEVEMTKFRLPQPSAK